MRSCIYLLLAMVLAIVMVASLMARVYNGVAISALLLIVIICFFVEDRLKCSRLPNPSSEGQESAMFVLTQMQSTGPASQEEKGSGDERPALLRL